MQRHYRRSRFVAAGLSVGALVGLATGMVVTERVSDRPVVSGPSVGAPATDPFASGGAARPPSTTPTGRIAHTVTGAS